MNLEYYLNDLTNQTEINLMFFLVGSKVKGTFTDLSDTDFIAYTSDNINTENLQETARSLNDFIHNKIPNESISIKVFDRSTFHNLYCNDFIRYLEYRLSHFPVDKEIESIFMDKCLSKDKEFLKINVINSLVIQIVWTTFKILENKNNREYLIKKFIKRVYRNIYLISGEYNIKFEALEILQLTHSYISSEKIINSDSLDLNSYYLKFQHELINKAYIYNSIIKKVDNVIIKDTINYIFLETKNQLENDILFTSRTNNHKY